MNIVLFSSSYAPRVGGVETAVARLAREFQRQGHRVAVITNRYPRALPATETVDGVMVYRILFPALVVPRAEWRRTRLDKYLLLLPLAPLAALRLWLLLRRLRPRIVNVHYLSSPALYIALLSTLRLLRARVVISCHGSDLATVPYPTGSPGLSRWAIGRAQAVTACSSDLAHYVRLSGSPIPDGAVRVVYNGADVDEFAGLAPFEGPRPYIFTAGRLVEKKGTHFLIEALAALGARGVDCDLIIAGSGPEEARLRALAARLGLAARVHFVGPADRARLGALYHGCAVFAMAPLWEAFGIVNLEAMSCGRPVVATRAGGIPEVVVDGETGLLARPADPADLAAKLESVLSDPRRAAEMGRRGRERVVERFTWPVVAARYLAGYQTALNGEAAPSGARRARGPGRRLSRAGRGGTAIPILMYHQVAPPRPDGVKASLLVTPEAFAAQMRWLHRLGWRTLRLVEALALLDAGESLPRRHFALTFDDAFLGVAHYAAPALRTLGFTATIFAPTGLVGTATAPDGGPESPAKRLMGWDDLRALRHAGFDIGAHTRTHPHLPQLSDTALRAEIAGSREDIARALGVAPALFAYPYGEWSPAVASAVYEAGFMGACATEFGRLALGAHRFALPRISISGALDLPHFAYRLAFADHIAAKIAAADASGAPSYPPSARGETRL